MGSLSNGSGSPLAYSIQTNTPANAFEIILPTGVSPTGSTFPPGFSAANCIDTANAEKCTNGTVASNRPLKGTLDHTGSVAANCGCVQVAFSKDNGKTWFPNPPVAFGGPPSSSPPPSPQPTLTPIHAVFTSSTVPGCSPPACTTAYTENATGQGLSYQWAVSIPADPPCGNGFQPNKPQTNQATWYHADVSEGGSCNHTGTTYDATGRGHPGTVVVQVSNAYWSCAATYYGTQGDNGNPVGDGPTPQACQPKAKP